MKPVELPGGTGWYLSEDTSEEGQTVPHAEDVLVGHFYGEAVYANPLAAKVIRFLKSELDRAKGVL